MKTKRTRPIRGKYYLTIPRVAIAGRTYEIKLKISQVVIEDVGRAAYRGTGPHGETEDLTGEIERGRVDGVESD